MNGVCKCARGKQQQNGRCIWSNLIKNCPPGTKSAGFSCIPIIKPSLIKDAK